MLKEPEVIVNNNNKETVVAEFKKKIENILDPDTAAFVPTIETTKLKGPVVSLTPDKPKPETPKPKGCEECKGCIKFTIPELEIYTANAAEKVIRPTKYTFF